MAHLRSRRIAVAVGLLLGCSAALADPVSLIATAIVYAGGYTGLTAFAIIAAGSLVSSALASNAAKRKQAAAAAAQRAQYNASLQDRNVTGLSAEAPWQIVYGNPAPIGGSLCAILSSGTKDEFKHLLIVFAAHECQAIDEVYIDGEPVGALNANGDAIDGAFVEDVPVPTSGLARWVGHVFTEVITFNTGGQGTASQTVIQVVAAIRGYTDANGDYAEETYLVTGTGTALTISPAPTAPLAVSVTYQIRKTVSRVNIQKHLSPGGVDVADSYVGNRAGAGVWTSTDKLSGYTYIWITLDQNLARFQGGPPNISARLRGKKIYDWRTGTTVYSQNPALCLADFITSRAGFGAAAAQIDSASVIASANAADAAGFLCDGSFRTEQGRDATKQQLEDCFGATCHESGGVWRINAGAWTTPVLTIADADCAAPIQIGQASYTAKERFNTVRGKFVDGAGLGVATDFSPWKNAAYVTADGGEKVLDVTFPFTKDHQRCQDLARMLVERSRGGLTITYPGQMRLWPLQPGDRVSVTNAEFGWAGKTFRVTDWAFHPKTPVALQMVEDVAAYYNPAAVITADAAPNTNLGSPFSVPDLAGLTASSGTAQLLKQADGTITTRVLLQWVASNNGFVTAGGGVQVQWRLATAMDDVWQSIEPLPGDASSAYLGNLPDGYTVLLRARFVNQLDIAGQWSTIAHQVIGKTAPPPDVTVFTINGDLLRWTPVEALDLAGYLVRFNYGNNAYWAAATPAHSGIITDSPYALANRPAGVVTLMIKAVDTSGNESSNASAIVTNLGDPLVSNVLVSYPQAPLFTGTITAGAVSAGVLQANATDLFYGDDDQPFYGADGDVFYPLSTYAQMIYEWALTPVDPGTLLLLHSIAASDYGIEYRRDSQAAFYGSDADQFYGPDAEAFYGIPGEWSTWPGALALVDAEEIRFRITTAGGPTRGQISTATVVLDVPDVGETLNDIVISAGGTRLPITQAYRVIQNVQLTVQADGNGGISARIEDKSSVSGPLITVRNDAGTAVAGLVDADIQGY